MPLLPLKSFARANLCRIEHHSNVVIHTQGWSVQATGEVDGFFRQVVLDLSSLRIQATRANFSVPLTIRAFVRRPFRRTLDIAINYEGCVAIRSKERNRPVNLTLVRIIKSANCYERHMDRMTGKTHEDIQCISGM